MIVTPRFSDLHRQPHFPPHLNPHNLIAVDEPKIKLHVHVVYIVPNTVRASKLITHPRLLAKIPKANYFLWSFYARTSFPILLMRIWFVPSSSTDLHVIHFSVLSCHKLPFSIKIGSIQGHKLNWGLERWGKKENEKFLINRWKGSLHRDKTLRGNRRVEEEGWNEKPLSGLN